MSKAKFCIVPADLNAFQLMKYNIDPDSVLGVFLSDKKPLEAVAKFPELHIVSRTGHFWANRYIPNSPFYYLSAGDPNPELEETLEDMTPEDFDEWEEDKRIANGGVLPMDLVGAFKFMRMIFFGGDALNAVSDPEHRRRVREVAKEKVRVEGLKKVS